MLGRMVATHPNPPPDTVVTQDQIEQEPGNLIAPGTLIGPGANTLYMVHFPPGVTILTRSYGWGSYPSCSDPSAGFCGFHDHFNWNGTWAYYGIVAGNTTVHRGARADRGRHRPAGLGLSRLVRRQQRRGCGHLPGPARLHQRVYRAPRLVE